MLDVTFYYEDLMLLHQSFIKTTDVRIFVSPEDLFI